MNGAVFPMIAAFALAACTPSPQQPPRDTAPVPPAPPPPAPAPAPAAPAPAPAPPADPQDAELRAGLVPALDRAVGAAIGNRATPGASVAAGRQGRAPVLRAYGRTDWAPGARAVTDSTIYDLASLTKAVATTTAAMILEDEGRLALDRPVAAYLPGFGAPDKAPITVRMLLTHTSGLRADHTLYREIRGRAAYLARIDAHPLAARPGTRFRYDDWNFVVLQLAMEQVTGEPLDRWLQRRVWGPLGMRDTGFNPPPSLRPRIAPTEVQRFRGGQLWGEVHDENAWALGGVAGHAGLFSSARDLAVFARMLLEGGTHGGVRIVRPETVARWTRRQGPGSTRALGWDTYAPRSGAGRLFSPRSFGHTGFTGTSLWIDPERGVYAILLTNRVNPTRDNPRIPPVRSAVADAVQRAAAGAR
jgi:CubicO group peptidase (beta-lactamase class C family)